MDNHYQSVTDQAALLLKGGGCGVVASPPRHNPHFQRKLSRYINPNYFGTIGVVFRIEE